MAGAMTDKTPLEIRPRSECRWDLISLGEVMLRFDPGPGRISTSRRFDVYEGGGEYNVARGLKRCFGLETAIVTAFADNAVGRLLQDLIYQGGVDQSLIRWREYDGVGRELRNGLNFVERGFGVRAALGCSDRGHTAASQLKPGEIDWDEILGRHGTRWFHTGGIFCALSESTPKIALEAIQAARSHGVIVSYDLNFRESLWRSYGGKEKAREVNRSLAPYIDVVFGNEEDFSAALGHAIPGMNERHTDFTSDGFKCMIQAVARDFPFRVVAATLRKAKTATVNDWGAICYTGGQFYQSMQRENLEIFDRVGGGDSFAAGLIYGLLEGKNPQWAVECGAAHGALAMTTPGDTSMVDLKEVLRVMDGDGARITR
jgi:2-dehydro-3-deoxygluconokinase